eukprot:813240-Rhodomonas_salina.1
MSGGGAAVEVVGGARRAREGHWPRCLPGTDPPYLLCPISYAPSYGSRPYLLCPSYNLLCPS